MRFGSLFAGIGGFDLGLERAGMQCAWQVEIDEFCTKVLTKHWPDVPKYGDIRNVGKRELEPVDLICGGFPCQPFSVAGKQRGKEDDRHLWPEMLRVISELKPTWVIGENVPGIINIFLDQAISDLEAEGYTCETFILPACAFNAPHRRDRLWAVAHRKLIGRGGWSNENAQGQGGEVQATRSCSGNQQGMVADTDSQRKRKRHNGAPIGRNNTKIQGREDSKNSQNKITNIDLGCKNVPNTDTINAQGIIRKCADEENREKQRNGQVGSLHSIIGGQWSTESRLGGMVDGLSSWLHEPDIPRVATGVKDRTSRLKALGNAVVPAVAQHIGEMIMDIDSAR